MVQSVDSMMKPTYNAVDIKIRKPEVNAGDNEKTRVVNDNGVYNGVRIDIDNPTVNTAPAKKIYDYPENNEMVTYGMIDCNRIALPEGFPVATSYESTAIIVPNEGDEDICEEINETEETNKNVQEDSVENNTPSVPEPNFTTIEAEKDEQDITVNEDNNAVSFHGKEDAPAPVKKPEIIPSEDIKPDVDINKVVANLNSDDYDIQAQQMEEIVKTSLEEPEKTKAYLVRDVFSSLIDTINKDTKNLQAPSEKQVDARKKLMIDFIAMEKGAKTVPYQLNEDDIALANELSPLEMAERNKEYAIATTATLAKAYTDGVEKANGTIVPITDVPGTSAIVEALRKDPNPGVKMAAIDALAYIHRPEYNEEISTVFKLAQADPNPQVVLAAQSALTAINQK